MNRKGSPIKDDVDKKLLRLQEAGFFNKWQEELEEQSAKEEREQNSAVEGFTETFDGVRIILYNLYVYKLYSLFLYTVFFASKIQTLILMLT